MSNWSRCQIVLQSNSSTDVNEIQEDDIDVGGWDFGETSRYNHQLDFGHKKILQNIFVLKMKIHHRFKFNCQHIIVDYLCTLRNIPVATT